MAITSSAKRAIRVHDRKRVYNERRKSAMKSAVKEVGKLITAKDRKAAEAKMPEVQEAIDKAAKGGIIKKGNAARKKSRLVASIKKLD